MSDFGEIQGGDDWDRSGRAEPYQDYGAPAASGPPPGALAGFWIRFAAFLIDGLVVGVIANVLASPFTGPAPEVGTGFNVQIVSTANAAQLILSAIYFVYFHSTKAGQTLGKRVCGIRLVDEAAGGQVDPGRAFLRFVMSYVSAFPLFLGYFWMLWDAKNQTWHDKVASTLVVYSRVVPAPTTSLVER